MSWLSFWRRKRAAATPSSDGSGGAGRGRHYVTGVPYVLPKDLDETNRLDFQHYMLRSFFRSNYLAPISQPRDILDVGCGTGRWAMEMATEFLDANVIGADIAPPPITDNIPSGAPAALNYTFVQGNVLGNLPFADNTFDFVHQRYLILAIPAARWPRVVNELLRVTHPGGWIELIETAPPSGAPAIDQLATWGKQLVGKRGIDMAMAAQIGPLLTAAGATQVSARTYTIPVGKPGGRIGSMMVVDYLSALAGIRGPLASLGIASEAAFDQAIAQARVEFDRREFPQSIYVAYARKL